MIRQTWHSTLFWMSSKTPGIPLAYWHSTPALIDAGRVENLPAERALAIRQQGGECGQHCQVGQNDPEV